MSVWLFGSVAVVSRVWVAGLVTGADLLSDKQRQRISALFADDEHLEVEATWGVYQAMVAAYRDPDRTSGKTKMQQLIDTLATGVPAALLEIRTLAGP